MLKFVGCLALLALPIAVGAEERDQSSTLTVTQQRRADELVKQYKAACLAGAPPPANAPESVRAMLLWQSEPDLCSCNVKSLERSLTPAVLSGSQEQLNEFLVQWAFTGQASCIVPHAKQRMREQCVQMYKEEFKSGGNREERDRRIRKLGFENADEVAVKLCACINQSASRIDVEEWTRISLDNYHQYIASRSKGQPFSPKANALTDSMEQCMRDTFGRSESE